MKKHILSLVFIICAIATFSQHKTYDIITFTAPRNWTEKQAEGNITYSRIDGGSWAQIVIYHHRNSEGDIQSDFDKDWKELVVGDRTISVPEKTEPKTEDGWWVTPKQGKGGCITLFTHKKL